MTTEEKLAQLEDRIDELLQRYEELRRENARLRAELQQAHKELQRNRLADRERQDTVRDGLQSVLRRIDELEAALG